MFADTATFVAHENMARNMDGRYPQMPGDMIDRNDNGGFDFEDIDVPTNARPGVCGFSPGFLRCFDRNSDDVGRRKSCSRHRRPTLVYSDRMTIELGGQVVELIHPGLNHSDDATVMLFPEQRVLFATEFLADALVVDNIRSLPSACGPFDGSPLAEWIKSYETVEALDFDAKLARAWHAALHQSYVTAGRAYTSRISSPRSRRASQPASRSSSSRNPSGSRSSRLGELRAAAREQRRSGLPELAGLPLTQRTGAIEWRA